MLEEEERRNFLRVVNIVNTDTYSYKAVSVFFGIILVERMSVS